MAASHWRTALILALALAGPPARTGGAEPEDAAPPLKLGKLPDLRLTPRPPVTEAQAKRIKELIAGLAALDKPDFGLSATFSGGAFAAIPGQVYPGAMILLDDHGLRRSENIRELVALGPEALPFLLDALDDQTPTKLTVTHTGHFGGMWHGSELVLNPVNPAEEAVAKERAKKKRQREEAVYSYTIKVGDVCFVMIGQIVGREYQAVRYQPTLCTVLNCPAQDPKLCADVRAIWKAKDPRAKLFDSLRADYATDGGFTEKSLDSWCFVTNVQGGAALRLLYYFEKEAAPLIADRLDKLDVGKDGRLDSVERRIVANGLRAEYFVQYVAWSKNAAIREALTRLFKRAKHVDALLAAVPAVEDKDLLRSRAEPLLLSLPDDGGLHYGPGCQLLVALGQRTPGTAKPVFERYLKGASAERCHTACLALREVKVVWDVDVLGALLNDKRTFGWTYPVEAGKNEPRRPVRVCDEAAATLSQNHAELKFTQAGEHADLDEQIAAIRERLARKK